MTDNVKKFGRYFLLDLIAQGGMAEIYCARLAAVDGAGRVLVIKRIQPGYGSNNEFLQMFRSEIKVTMGFNHPNIVQLYDYGNEQNQPYIAMEFVDGKNLRQFLSRFNDLKQQFPVDLAVHIIEQAASGLHYAHCYRDKISGEPLNIVHRDISPQNILISYDGNVKVIDFGIAKATTNSESTRAGVIKGKPSYLSPEQISGDPLDCRCDIFALGIVLWELLTGKKLFAGENDLAVLKLIESAATHVKPPSTLNPKVPKELDYIVMKALAKQREKRYQTAEEMQRALHKFLYSTSQDFNPRDLSYCAKDLFKNEIVDERKRIQKLNDRVEELLALEIVNSQSARMTESGASGSPRKEDTATVVDGAKKSPVGPVDMSYNPTQASSVRVEFDVNKAGGTRTQGQNPNVGMPRNPARSPNYTATAKPTASRNPPKQNLDRGKPGGLFGKIAIGAVAVVAVIMVLGKDSCRILPVLGKVGICGKNYMKEGELTLLGNATNVRVEINGNLVATSLPATIKKIPVGTSFDVSVSGIEGSFQQSVLLTQPEKKMIQVELSTGDDPGGMRDPAAKQVKLNLNLIPPGTPAKVLLNEKPVDLKTLSVIVGLDSSLELVVERPGYRPFRREFTVDSKQVKGLKEWRVDVQLDPEKFGYLTIRTIPSADAVYINGTKWPKTPPFISEKFAIGDYEIRLVNEILQMEKTLKGISVQEGKELTFEEKLEIKNEVKAQ